MTQSISDPYSVLGIPRDADRQTALEAYRRLAKRFHPDFSADPAAAERMRRINEAWSVLSNPSRRARFDSAPTRDPFPDDRSVPYRSSPWVTSYQWTEPAQPEVQRDAGSLWPVILVAVGAFVLLFGATIGMGFVSPLFVILLLLALSRIFRAIS